MKKKWLHSMGKVEKVEIETECEYLYKVKGKGSWGKKASLSTGLYAIESDALQVALIYMQVRNNDAKKALAEIEKKIDGLNNRLAASGEGK